jgi:hypothetical protein
VSLKKTTLLWASAWLVAISFLHAWLNLGLFEAAKAEKSFKVGFLPVT